MFVMPAGAALPCIAVKPSGKRASARKLPAPANGEEPDTTIQMHKRWQRAAVTRRNRDPVNSSVNSPCFEWRVRVDQ